MVCRCRASSSLDSDDPAMDEPLIIDGRVSRAVCSPLKTPVL